MISIRQTTVLFTADDKTAIADFIETIRTQLLEGIAKMEQQNPAPITLTLHIKQTVTQRPETRQGTHYEP